MKWSSFHLCRIALLAMACAAQFATGVPCARAEGRPVQLSIVFSPGGSLDTAARILAREAEKDLGVDIVPHNAASGGGMTGVAKLAHAEPDGSRLAVCVSNTLVFIPHRQKTPYRPFKDVEPLLIFGQASPVLVTRPDSPWTDMESFLEKARGGKKLKIGVPGLGTPSHIALAIMAANDAALNWRFIPFGGPGEAEAALLGGHIDAAASGALPRIKNGQLRPLMVLAGSRLEALPEVPSLTDGGFSDPGRGDSAFVLLAPAGLPEEKAQAISDAFGKAAQSKAYREAMAGFSVAPVLMDREGSKTFLRDAWHKEGALLKAVGLAGTPATSPD